MKQKADPFVSNFRVRNKLNKLVHKHYIISLFILVVLIVAVVLVIQDKRKSNDMVVTDACSSGNGKLLVGQAANYFRNSSDIDKLSGTVSQIEQLHDYQNDPNCMYAITVNYIDQFNVPKAESSLILFNKAYTGQKLNPSLLVYASVDTLRSEVSDMKLQSQQDLKNSEALSPKSPPTTKK